jgi:uncharacterized protein YbjT (DUF2867 family)
MTRPKVLVTGATGKTGAVVISELLKAGYPVRALVRREDSRSAALQARGAEIAVADMTDSARVAAALRGVQRAYWLPPYDPSMLTGAAVLATAAREAGLESIVSLSQWLASPSHPAFLTRQHWLADRLLAMIPGVALTIVNPGLFADDPYLSTIGYAAHLGVMPWMFGDTQTAPPSVEDIGRVAAAALMDPARHGGRTYRPTGPALLSGQDMAMILTRVLGRTVRLVPTSIGVFLKAARQAGYPPALLSLLPLYAEELRRGTFALGAPNHDVQQVTGRAAEPFEAVARRHAALPANRRSPLRTLRELARFLAVPLVPALDAQRYLRGLNLTSPAAPEYADESAVWRREHGFGPQEADSVTPEGARLAPAVRASGM